MSGQAQARIDAETDAANPRWITASETLRPGNQNIIADSTAAEMTVTLPDVGECVGNIICIVAPYGNAQDTVFVVENEDGAAVTGTSDMDADNDYIILFCTGREWLVLATDTV